MWWNNVYLEVKVIKRNRQFNSFTYFVILFIKFIKVFSIKGVSTPIDSPVTQLGINN